jgi:hypothetical protein
MTSSSPEQPWTCECHENVALWDVTDWETPEERVGETAIDSLVTVADREDITASVTVLGASPTLDETMRRFLDRQRYCYWRGDLEKVGFVSSTLTELSSEAAVTDAVGIDPEPFDDLQTAFRWARE